MGITIEEKVKVFEDELERIDDVRLREFTRLCLVKAPDYIFIDCPSSSSSKYHPIDELGPDGLVVHTKKVFTMAYEIVKAFCCECNRDLVLAAALIHDLRKRGIEYTEHTLPYHPRLAAELVDEVQDATQLLTNEQYKILRDCVNYHYGPWTERELLKDIMEFTREELAVFISDYVVSKRFIHTDYRR